MSNANANPNANATALIISTYNQPRYLELVLLGCARQTTTAFEIVIADDGSTAETRALIDSLRPDIPVPIRHVWQPDDGFRKAMALNRAVLQTPATHLVFTDGDCIPPSNFIALHLAAAAPNTYVVGGHIRLSQAVSATITPDSVRSGAYESLEPRSHRLWRTWMHWKNLLHIATRKRRRPKFYGLNFSVPRDVFLAVNGFDQTYANAGREDSDLRNRMQVARYKARCIWHTSVVFHLWHPFHQTRNIWTEVDRYYKRKDLRPLAPNGIRELPAASEAPA